MEAAQEPMTQEEHMLRETGPMCLDISRKLQKETLPENNESYL